MARSDSRLVLAVDLGTSSVRSALFRSNGERILKTTAQQNYPTKVTADGGAEHSPGGLLAAVEKVIHQTLGVHRASEALRRHNIAAVGVSSYWHGLMGTTSSGRPLTPAYTWADSRANSQVPRLKELLLCEEYHQKTGCMIHSCYWPAKLAWLRSLRREVKLWMSPVEWILSRFLNSMGGSIGMAAATGLMNARTLDWDDSILKALRIDRRNLLSLKTEAGFLNREWRSRWPELKDAIWVPPMGDGAASNIGSVGMDPGLAAINIGTSAAVRVLRQGFVQNAPYGVFAYRVDQNRTLVGGAVSNAGNLREWCLRELGVTPELLGKKWRGMLRDKPAHGLIVLPYWVAERAPWWRNDLVGCIHGLKGSTTALDLFRAVVEGTYHRLAILADMLQQHERKPLMFVVSGGVQKSRPDMQLLSNVIGQPLIVSTEPQASLRGAALIALERLGIQVPQVAAGPKITPDPLMKTIYRKERDKQVRLEKLLFDV